MTAMFFHPVLRGSLQAQGTFCSIAVDVPISSESISNIFSPGNTWPSGTKISVTGTLTVDQSITFGGLEFIMGSGAKIIVEGTSVVMTTTSNIRFYGCSTMTMWRGIFVQGGGSIALSGSTKIEDAWTGITFAKTANIAGSSIDQTILEDNMTGIYYVGPGTFKLASFSNNDIKRGIGSILPPPSGLTYDGSQLWRGIFLHSANADFASNAAVRNEFSGYRYGIAANSSTLTIANSSFSNNLNDNVLSDTLDGTDISTYNSTLNVGGTGALNCTFYNTYNSGIISRNTRGLSVNGAYFESPNRYGIRCPQSIKLSSPILIADNDFEMNGGSTVAAIYVERPPSGPESINTSIKDNNIFMDGGHQKGSIIMIDLQGKMDATDIAEINHNTIDIDRNWRQIHGIRITGKGNNYQVINDNNLSWLPGTGTYYSITGLLSRGITANDLMGSDNFIVGNDIVSQLNTTTGQSFLKAGIHLENNPFSLFVCENQIDSNHYNLYCAGGLGSTRLVKNLINDAGYGLYCKAGTVMPHQDRFENRWTGSTYVTRGAEYQGGAPGFKIFYDPSGTISDDKPNTVLPTSGWFDEASGSNPVCGINGGTVVTETERQFIDGTTSSSAATDNWDTRRILLYKLMRYPELTTGDEDAANYLDDNETANSSTWQFARAEHLFDQAYVLSAPLQTAFTNMTAQFRLFCDTLVMLDAQQASDMSGFDATIAQKRANIFDKLVFTADSLEQLRAQADATVLPALDTALMYAQSLPDTQVYEENLREILTIAIRFAQGDSLLGSDYTALRSIASQCPATGGISVRRAPQWLEHEEAVTYLDKEWDDNCSSPLISGNKDLSVAPLAVKVAPNPADNQIQILLQDDVSGSWQVTDLTGRIVKEGNITGAMVNISTADMTGGLYLLTCKSTAGEVSTIKMSICH